MTTDFGSRISESDSVPIDSSLVREIVDAVNAQLEEYAAANGSLTNEATKEMAKNLIMRQLEQHTFTSADAGRGVMSASDEIAVMEAVLERMFGIGPLGPLLADKRWRTSISAGLSPWC